MKKLLFMLAMLFAFNFSYAQWTTSGNDIYNSNSGNVGIGTTNPAAKLSITPVSTTLSNMSHSFIAGSKTAALADAAGSYLYPFEFQHSNTSNTDRLQFNPYRRIAGTSWLGTAYRLQFAVDNSFTNGSMAYIEVGATDPNVSGGGFISLGTEGFDRLAVTSSGNVGIGTTSPTSNLQIGTLDGVSTSAPITLSLGATFSSTHGINPKLKVYDDGVNTWGLGISSSQLDYIVSNNNDHVFYAGGVELTRMKSNGNVGIGTAIPDAKLAVNGTIHSTEVRVDLSVPGPDYVFNTDYKLTDLSDRKIYLDQNHHLPEIPSANQMAKEGLNLGDMNTKLLKKVEELTLYLIDENKEKALLNNKVNSQQTQIDQLKQMIETLSKEIHKN